MCPFAVSAVENPCKMLLKAKNKKRINKKLMRKGIQYGKIISFEVASVLAKAL
jgi:hypothetical protein